MLKADDVGACLPESRAEAEPLGVVRERHEARLTVAVVAHEDRELSSGLQHAFAVEEQELVATQERRQVRATREVAGVVRVPFLSPVGRMEPDEVEAADRFVVRRVARIEALAHVAAHAGDSQLPADVGARARSRHGVENALRFEI